METTSDVCAPVTLISFYTMRTFNHETTRTQLRVSRLEHCWQLLPVYKVCCGAGHCLQRAMAVVTFWPPESLQDDCGRAGLAKASQDFSRGHLAPGQCSHQHYLIPAPQTQMSRGLRIDLICPVQENAISPLLLPHRLLSVPSKRKVMAPGRGLMGRKRIYHGECSKWEGWLRNMLLQVISKELP